MLSELDSHLHDTLFAAIERISKDLNLHQQNHFNDRLQAIDYLEFHVIDHINAIAETGDLTERLASLRRYAAQVKDQLEEANTSMFQRLRTRLAAATNKGKLLTELIDEHADGGLTAAQHENVTGYDNLDIFLNGLLAVQALPAETCQRDPEMVYYQKTPAMIIFELIRKAAFKPGDVFIDIGSGLGQVVLLVKLLTAAIAKGIEFEPAYCHYARTCAADLNLHEVQFVNADARYADYTDGTVFFLYTPFEGAMLEEVLQKLKQEAVNRQIKIFTYGPCTQPTAQQPWLITQNGNGHDNALGAFVSS